MCFTRAKFAACKVHQEVVGVAVEHMNTRGSFSKDEVLAETGFTGVADSIRWDYVREAIERELGVHTVPVVSRFFSKRPGFSKELSPEKFVASGYGKKTAGFAAVRDETAPLAGSWLSSVAAKAEGAVAAADIMARNYGAAGVAIPGAPAQGVLPDLNGEAGETPSTL